MSYPLNGVNHENTRNATLRTVPGRNRQKGTALDPFNGAGTTGLVCQRLGRNYIGIELNEEHISLTRQRLGLTEMTTDTASDDETNFRFAPLQSTIVLL